MMLNGGRTLLAMRTRRLLLPVLALTLALVGCSSSDSDDDRTPVATEAAEDQKDPKGSGEPADEPCGHCDNCKHPPEVLAG